MKILLRSKKLGNKWCYFDSDDAKLISNYKWHIRERKGLLYAVTNIDWNQVTRTNKALYMHQLVKGRPKKNIDHKDGNGLNNQKSNLRTCTQSQNCANAKLIQSNNTTGYRGVFFEKKKKLYRVIPPHISISNTVQMLKGKTSRKILSNFKEMQRTFWGRHFWARGYFVASSGNVTDEVIVKYIEQQDVSQSDNEFKIDGEL